jgi:hypothetical protein
LVVPSGHQGQASSSLPFAGAVTGAVLSHRQGKWRRLAGDLEASPTVGEAGMAREVGGTGGAIGSRARGREIFEDGGPDGEVSASGVDTEVPSFSLLQS